MMADAADAAIMKSPALAAQQRVRGPSVLQRRAAEEAALRAANPPRPPRAAQKDGHDAVGARGKVERGVSMKTGMVLARARLGSSTGGVVAAQERQASLLSKGTSKSQS